MKSTDRYYDIGYHLVMRAQSRICDALLAAPEKHSMTVEGINALSRILAYRLENGSDDGQYEHAIDYLWMCRRIEINHKMLLLDLLTDTTEE